MKLSRIEIMQKTKYEYGKDENYSMICGNFPIFDEIESNIIEMKIKRR